jgi:hypothetical protein
MKHVIHWLLLGAALVGAGCGTNAFCFDQCGKGSGNAASSDASTADGSPIELFGQGGSSGIIQLDGQVLPTDECANTQEVCNGIDDDCNGLVDDNIDYTSPRNCGNCATDCTLQTHVMAPICQPPAVLDGTQPGTCSYSVCETDFYDIDPLVPGCEYYCQWNPDGTTKLDLGGAQGCGKDDDCDGLVDEDVDMCKDLENCGKCGKKCVTPHATAACVTTATAAQACVESNTHCAIVACEKGWVDADGSPDNGCEYQCTPTDPPTEVCDGLDNDCDKLIDDADPDLEATVGRACVGGTKGICRAVGHRGVTKCIGGEVTCCDPDSNQVAGKNPAFPSTGLRNGVCDADTGPQVVRPGDVPETCNGLDDDCNGTVDDSPRDVGTACGSSSVGNCAKGVFVCVAGVPTCVGAAEPQPEICNGQDDNCDGVIDGILPAVPTACNGPSDCPSGQLCLAATARTGKWCAAPPVDATGDCDVPLPPPAGATSACSKGTRVCQGGLLRCSGSVTALPGVNDTCGVDANCDGVLDNQPNLSTDVHRCGSCTNDCVQKNAFVNWICQNGQCVANGCIGNRIDCIPNDNDPCDTACTPTSAQEVCNGIDDDCNCKIDDNVTPLSPAQACGVVPGADDAGCQPRSATNPGGVLVECVSGAWRCTFAAGYCPGRAPDYCTGQPDPCDGKDNNCNGLPDEGFVRPLATQNVKGDPCTTSDLGACQATGTYVCNTAGTGTVCSGQSKPPTNEVCNGIDDDCDGLVDESYLNPGNDPSFVKPAVVALGASGPWVFAYEASRPNASIRDGGSGNGYFDSGPAGEPRDRTPACSLQGRIPWTNVTPWEAEQSCSAIGGRVCRLSDWQQGCRVNAGTTVNGCLYGYSPAGAGTAACQQPANYTSGPFCNLGAYDSNTTLAGNQDGLIPTGSPALSGCFAAWASYFGNTLGLYDITGNAREITRCQPDRAVCGGASNAAAQCATDCCSGSSTAVTGPAGAARLCGTLGNNQRRLGGQACNANVQCCDNDISCAADGVCDTGICRSATGSRCLARGLSGCDATNLCCGTTPCTGGVCGGAGTLLESVYPLMGGGYETVGENGASCNFTFFKVESDFRLFDTGFRCCFDQNPTN